MSSTTAATTTQPNTQDQPAVRDHRARRIVGTAGVFILRLALAATFANAGIMKLSLNEQTVAGFSDLGGVPMAIFVGLLEVAGAIGLMVPILSGFAAIGLTALLVIITAVTAAEFGASVLLVVPVACLVVAAVLVPLRWKQTVRLARFLRALGARARA